MNKKSVVMSILAFGLFALTAKAADAVKYLDESGNTRSVPVGAYTLVTDATTTLGDGWYVVAYPDVVRGGMTVSGNARLILCDGMSLTVQGDYHQPGITVPPGASLSVYGQVAGTGVLRATGGASGAGIGGGDWGACGTVTINGGRVTAQGGDYGAGIGGGYGGAGGMVSINGGALSSKGGIYGADIGGGFSGAAGTVSISGGIFAQEPDSKWMVSGFSVRANTDEATHVLYPWTVTPGYGVTVGDVTDVSAVWMIEGSGVTNVIAASSFRVPSGATVTIVFRPKPARRFADGSASKSVTVTVTGDLDVSFRVPQTVSSPVEYLDENGNTRSLSAGAYTLVTAATTTLGDGWYVVADPDVVRGGMTVSGSARLILFDGMSLTVQGGYHQPGVAVPSGASLSVYGQVAGTGVLRATGGASGAGIGGGDFGACGTVTINGGRVTTEGGNFGAGIGGGYGGAGGTVTINGGAVSATGGISGADIGGGSSGAAGTVSISGGIFARKPDPAWLAEGIGICANPDEATRAAYPWAVLPNCYEVTVGELKGVSAVWTSGDGSVTNALEGTSFKANAGETVTVLVSPKDKNCFLYGGEKGYTFVIPWENVNLTGKFASAALYLDANGEPQTRDDYILVTAETTTFVNGKWYVVNSDVSRGAINVSGNAHLILCDGAKLTVDGGIANAGIHVTSGNSISIYGQIDGTGVLDAKSSDPYECAGIGGVLHENCGTVTINGGMVIANGSTGIGGGAATTLAIGDVNVKGGNGGTVTINGGTVTATGLSGSGIGGGYSNASGGHGGTVTINGGTVTASTAGWSHAAAIGGGPYGSGGNVMIRGGCVKAKSGMADVADIGGGGYGGTSGSVSISGGCFGMTVQEKWLASGYSVMANQDAAICGEYPWMVALGCRVTVGELSNMTAVWTCEGSGVTNAVTETAFNVPRDATVTILFTSRVSYSFDGKRFESLTLTVAQDLDISGQVPKAEASPVEYIDENGVLCTVDVGSYTLVTAETSTIGDGWYVVADPDVSRDSLSVTGHAHLILGDGTSLAVQGSDDKAGLCVPVGETITIYGQRLGTGVLQATGGKNGAGIGGGYDERVGCVIINGGTVTAIGGRNGAGIGGGFGEKGGCVIINGGTVTATAGDLAAGIGGGRDSAGGTVTINGGAVTATGGQHGAGIGGGMGSACGQVTINGGTVTATGGGSGSGIGGGGMWSESGAAGEGGTVVIRGGRVSATGQDGADAIGSGVNAKRQKSSAGTTSISDGVFAMELKNDWLAERHLVLANDDPETCQDYPWTVVPACRVTVGELKNLSVAWTFGDGAVTNVVSGPSFLVYSNMSATVVFTPANGYWLDGEPVVELGVVTEDQDLTGRVVARPNELAYVKEDGTGGTVSDYAVVHVTTNALDSGWHAVLDADVMCNAIQVTGAAKLLLCNGAKLSVLNGISVADGASLTVYAQAGDAGFLESLGSAGEPGIGGAGAVTIVGGTVMAAGDGDGVPGIGAKSVVIRGGSVGASVLNARDASGTALYRVTVEGLGTTAPTFADLPSGYGTAGISPIDGAVYLWWPNGTYGFKVNGEAYAATVRNAHVVAVKAVWTIGTGVTAAWTDGELTISGKGTIDDFASAADVPWRGLTVSNMTIPAEVKPGRNLFAGFGDTTTVNGVVPVSLIRQAAGDFLVGGLTPAEAKALEIDGGQVRLTVEVDASTDLKNWKPAKTVEIAVPVEGEKGFYLLKSK